MSCKQLMLMKYRLLICLMFFSLPLLAQNSSVENEFISKIHKYNSDIRSIKCKCTQNSVFAIFDKPKSVDGMFYYLADNNIIISLNNGDYIKIIDSVLEMKTGKEITKIKLSSNPALKNLNILISSCFKGDFSTLKSIYNISYSKNSEGSYTLLLIPKKTSKSKNMSVELLFNGKDMSLDNLKMIESEDNYTEYVFRAKEYNMDVKGYFSK